MLAAMLGINNYGNREIARVRGNREKTSGLFWEIYRLQLLIVGSATIGYLFYTVFLCKEYKNIAAIQGLYLISVFFDINWFYFGLEKFKLPMPKQ